MSKDKKQNYKKRKDDGYKSLEMINNWIANVDTKISFALAFIGILLGFILSSGTPTAYTTLFDDIETSSVTCWNIVSVVIVTLLFIALLICVMYLIKGLTATVDTSDTNKDSMLFFGAIANTSLNDYNREFVKAKDKELLNDLVEQVHTNSRICNKKFANYNKSIRWLIITVVLVYISCIFGML